MNLGIDLELNWRVNKKHLEFCKCFFVCAYPVLCKFEHRCRTERQEPESDHDAKARNETGAEDTGTEYARSISDKSSEEEDGSRDRSSMSRARSNDTVIPVDVDETTTGDGYWNSRQMMTMLSRCMQKRTTNAAVKVNLNLPKWTDEQDPERFFTLFESVMEDHDIPEDRWLKHLKPTL